MEFKDYLKSEEFKNFTDKNTKSDFKRTIYDEINHNSLQRQKLKCNPRDSYNMFVMEHYLKLNPKVTQIDFANMLLKTKSFQKTFKTYPYRATLVEDLKMHGAMYCITCIASQKETKKEISRSKKF